GLEVAQVQLSEPVDHLAFAAGDAGHVDAHRPAHHAQTRGRVDERNGLGAINDILAGQAGHVWTGAAHHGSFDDNGFLALFRQGPGEDLARDAAANHEVLNALDHHDDVPVSY